MKAEVKTYILDCVAKGKFFGKKYKPEILLVGTIVSGVIGIVEIAKASTNVNEIVEETSAEMDVIRKSYEEGVVVDDAENLVEYSERDKALDTFRLAAKTTVSLGRLYGKAIIFEGISFGCLIAMYNEQKARNIAFASALSGIEQAFNNYRVRVREKYGDEEERQLYYGIKARTVEEKVVDEDGKEHTETKEVLYFDGEPSPYSKFFDESCPEWTKDPERNLWLLKAKEKDLNLRLRAKGYIFLNEVYYELGMPETAAGQIAGWVYDYKPGEPSEAETTIDFGIFDYNDIGCRAFVNGYSPSVLCDFAKNGHLQSNILYALE